MTTNIAQYETVLTSDITPSDPGIRTSIVDPLISFKLINAGSVSVEHFGALLDGVTDYVDEFIEARDFNNNSVEVPVGTYTIGNGEDFTGALFHSYGPVTILTNTTITVVDLLA